MDILQFGRLGQNWAETHQPLRPQKSCSPSSPHLTEKVYTGQTPNVYVTSSTQAGAPHDYVSACYADAAIARLCNGLGTTRPARRACHGDVGRLDSLKTCGGFRVVFTPSHLPPISTQLHFYRGLGLRARTSFAQRVYLPLNLCDRST